MSFPSVVSSQVDPAAVTKVTRLFNNTLADVLAELIQNARRAGATAIRLRRTEAEDETRLSISDDGIGIADPSVVLSLGRSGWDDQIARREDPAGMGVFSLAGRHVIFRSRARGSDCGWQIDIPSHAWEDGTPIPVSTCAQDIGTEIVLTLDKAWAGTLDAAARGAARYCPIPVFLDGEELKREDWLSGACAIFEEAGVRIGVFDDRRANVHSQSINFHGVTVAGAISTIAEKHHQWCARVDIVDAPDLQLVLPARKEMVENEALAELRRTVRRVMYRHIASRPSHRLPFAQWTEAAQLDVLLPEAKPELLAWAPATADIHTGITRANLTATDGLMIVEDFCPSIGQSAYLALDRDDRFSGRLASRDAQMEGYTWYGRLPRITDLSFEIEREGQVSVFSETQFPGLENGVVDRLDLIVTLNSRPDQAVSIPAPALVDYDEGMCCSVEEASIILTTPEAVSTEDLVDLLDAICFSASDDRDADSWDTQHDRFLLDAREIAVSILQGEDAAVLERLRAVLSMRVQWFVPAGRILRAVIGREGLQLAIEDAPADPA